MKIKIWGVRGSIPTPLQGEEVEAKIKKALSLARPGDISSAESIDAFVHTLPFSVKRTYGGNTTCIQVGTDSGETIIIDCGSGLINLGKELMAGDFGKGKGVGNILLTHTHWDHIMGIPFFVPIYIKGNRFNFFSAMSDLKERLEHQQVFTHFPKTLDYLPATKRFFKIDFDDDFYLNDTRVFTKSMPHPGGAFGSRIEDNGKVFVFTSDCEFNIESIDQINSYKELFINADVVIFDTMYTFEESFDKLDWGHSSASIAIDIAGKFNVKKLILFHHDPSYNDSKLENVLFNSKAYLNLSPKMVGKLEIDIAHEGMEIEI
ncbi:MAG: MBL fold metallo-hydrolase [bacterium]|nr:MBL fold metallo-hydrolase [bacterium]